MIPHTLRRVGFLLALTLAQSAVARQVVIGGVPQPPAIDSKVVQGTEYLALWTLPRLGVSVRNDPQDVRLVLDRRELRWSPARGWQSLGLRVNDALPRPQYIGSSLYVPLASVQALGVQLLSYSNEQLSFAQPAFMPSQTLPPSSGDTAVANPSPASPVLQPIDPQNPYPSQPSPSSSVQPQPVQPQPSTIWPPTPVAHLSTVRVSRTVYRTVEVQRLVLEMTQRANYSVSRERSGLSISLPNVSSSASNQTLPSGDSLSVQPSGNGTVVQLLTRGGNSEVFTLDNPFRVVIDTTTQLSASVPPPLNTEALPEGMKYQNLALLHLLSFDPQKYLPKVVSLPAGQSSDVATLVKSVQGVAGMNGGYFDTATALPVDLVVTGGQMIASSLEKRGTVGFTASGNAMFGYPKPRYFVNGAFGQLKVNGVRQKPVPGLLTSFLGDGQTSVGGDGYTTLYLNPDRTMVDQAFTGFNTPPSGISTLTFDPRTFPTMPQAAGTPLTLNLDWRADEASWPSAVDALSAGPMLVRAGQVVINPDKEGFNVSQNVWRMTRQVAFGVQDGRPVFAYFMFGTPEAFAEALAKAGVTDAVRLDSGSSSTVYVPAGGYGQLGGYVNSVWGQKVPNAIVMVPRKG